MIKKRIAWLRPALVGPHFLICILFGWYIGSRLDAWLTTKPWMTILFCFFGVAAGFLNLFRELKVINREEAEIEMEEGAEKGHGQ